MRFHFLAQEMLCCFEELSVAGFHIADQRIGLGKFLRHGQGRRCRKHTEGGSCRQETSSRTKGEGGI